VKKFLLLLIVSCGVGCGSLHADYIEKDRADYDAMQPCIEAGILSVGADTLDGKAYRVLNTSRDGRIVAAEEKIAKQKAAE
jgi:hypothetical protein